MKPLTPALSPFVPHGERELILSRNLFEKHSSRSGLTKTPRVGGQFPNAQFALLQ